MANNYSILINTCDNFEDCWIPFFKLFSIYWPDYKGKIYLNTEYKDFNYQGLDIVCTKVCEVNNFPKNKRATWSQCLKWALEQIDTDIVLYMQEDYFLKDIVKNNIINNFVDLMIVEKDIECIHLTDQGVKPLSLTKYLNLYDLDNSYIAIISCQVAIWRKELMKSHIRIHESAWNFEWWGTKRIRNKKNKIYVVDNNWVKKDFFEIVPYIFTGVIGGKWYSPVVNLFKSHNIDIDFTNRGFYDINKKKSLYELLKIKLSIYRIKSLSEIFKIRFIDFLKVVNIK